MRSLKPNADGDDEESDPAEVDETSEEGSEAEVENESAEEAQEEQSDGEGEEEEGEGDEDSGTATTNNPFFDKTAKKRKHEGDGEQEDEGGSSSDWTDTDDDSSDDDPGAGEKEKPKETASAEEDLIAALKASKEKKVATETVPTTGISGGATPGVDQKICRREERDGLDWAGSQYCLASGFFPSHRTWQNPRSDCTVVQYIFLVFLNIEIININTPSFF